jgi:APA family basic amino acid/polyamine antiporter
VGNAIGAGILRAPGEVAGHLPLIWLYLAAWVVGGLYALLGALQLAELGAMIPRSGGQYVFSRYALGEYPGFIVGWSDWISTAGTAAAYRLSLASSRSRCFRVGCECRGDRHGGRRHLRDRAVARHPLGQRYSERDQSAEGAGVCGTRDRRLPRQRRPGVHSSGSAAPAGMALVAAFVLSLQAVIYTYDGWSAISYFCEEVENPGRDIPRSMIGGVLSVIAIYLLVNLALLAVLPIATLAGQAFAAGTVAGVIFGVWGDPCSGRSPSCRC